MNTLTCKGPEAQGGVMLLEALIGILIFSIGILALVAMQANAIGHVANAQYRGEATALAEEVLGLILMDRGPDNTLSGVDAYALPGGGSHPPLVKWLSKVNTLPGAQANPPTITITTLGFSGMNGPTKQVTVVVRWKAPRATSVSNHTVVGFASGS